MSENDRLSSPLLGPPHFDDDFIAAVTDQRYPMLYSRGRDVDDAILQEVFVNLRTGGAELQTVEFAEGWLGVLQIPWIFNLSNRSLQLVGGMLYFDGNFLFDSLPFVCSRSREVKCRMDNPDLAAAATAASSGDLSQSMVAAMNSSVQMSSATRYLSTMTVPGGKVVFKVTEYECCCMYFVVQVFQLVNDGVPVGRFFVRAFYPYKPLRRSSRNQMPNASRPKDAMGRSSSLVDTSSSVVVAGEEAGDNEEAQTNDDSSTWGAKRKDFGTWKARRRAVPGEERLRLLKPWFYVWCLDRDPSELGTAITTVKLSLLYFKHNFTMIRLVRHLMTSVKRLQRFIRRRLATKARTEFMMITMWEKMEQDVQDKLVMYQPAKGDPVDAAVNRALRGSVLTSREHKIRVIGNLFRQRKVAYLEATPEQRVKERHLFTWSINPNVLFLDSQKRMIEKLTAGPESVFNDGEVQEELLRLQNDLQNDTKGSPSRRHHSKRQATGASSHRGGDGGARSHAAHVVVMRTPTAPTTLRSPRAKGK